RCAGGASAPEEVAVAPAAPQDNDEHRTWLGDLAAMYRGWAAHRGYEATPLVESDRPPRVMLLLAGPGALGFLAGEEGTHRRHVNGRRTSARVRLHPWPSPQGIELKLNVQVRSV